MHARHEFWVDTRFLSHSHPHPSRCPTIFRWGEKNGKKTDLPVCKKHTMPFCGLLITAVIMSVTYRAQLGITTEEALSFVRREFET